MKHALPRILEPQKSTGVLGREIETVSKQIAEAVKVYRGSRERD